MRRNCGVAYFVLACIAVTLPLVRAGTLTDRVQCEQFACAAAYRAGNASARLANSLGLGGRAGLDIPLHLEACPIAGSGAICRVAPADFHEFRRDTPSIIVDDGSPVGPAGFAASIRK